MVRPLNGPARRGPGLGCSSVDPLTGIAAPIGARALAGVRGGSPASVHTREELSEKFLPASGLREAGRRKRWTPRAAEGRGAKRGWRDYTRAVAAELEALGWGAVGARLRACGTVAEVRSCGSCGDRAGSVAVVAGCDSRACVLCSRRKAAEDVRRVSGAVARLPRIVAAGTAAARHGASERLARWDAQRAATDRRDREIRLAKRDLHGLRHPDGWRWRMITISPPWNPRDPAEYSPAGLAARVSRVREAWRALWDAGLATGGLAAALWRVEVSARGHVHAHVLYLGPWASQRWLAATAGMIVDVREARGERGRSAIVEAVKYALKGPAPRGAWLAGEASHVPHPRLAAAWVVASRGKRLTEAWGTMREALREQDASGPAELDGEPRAPCCASCGSSNLGDPWQERTARLAAELGAAWTLRPKRELRGGVEITLPPRVSFVRPLPV